jgi:divalent metal cation (Fe/Co/Zn/Cd) transporter
LSAIEKWADRVYAETDFGRSVATSAAGVIGLIVYIIFKDWVAAAFSSIITFPIIRLISKGLHEKANRIKKRELEREEAEHIYERLSEGKKM